MAAHIEADVATGAEQDDSNSDYFSESDASYATSLASFVRKYRYDNGRRYNGWRDKHWEPNDERQQDALDLLHHVFGLCFGGALIRAPIGDKPQRILDLGTGTGIFAVDMGDEYPSAIVIGNDLSPIQPAWVPPNVQFEVDDFNLPWTYAPNSFDYIHGRSLYGSVRDWPKLFGEALKALKPGGYFESVEFSIVPRSDDGTLPDDSSIMQVARKSLEAGVKMGSDFDIYQKTPGWMKDAGFVDIVEEDIKVPTNPWPKDPKLKEIGRFWYAAMAEAMEGFLMFIYTTFMGMSVEEVKKLVDGTLRDMRNRSYHAYYPMKVVYGRKPEGK